MGPFPKKCPKKCQNPASNCEYLFLECEKSNLKLQNQEFHAKSFANFILKMPKFTLESSKLSDNPNTHFGNAQKFQKRASLRKHSWISTLKPWNGNYRVAVDPGVYSIGLAYLRPM